MKGIEKGINKDIGENAHFENVRGAYPIFPYHGNLKKLLPRRDAFEN